MYLLGSLFAVLLEVYSGDPALTAAALGAEESPLEVLAEVVRAFTVPSAELTSIVILTAEAANPVAADDVLVHIRGSGVHLRAKVADNGDGSLTVTYTPDTTGEYHIDVSVHGEKPRPLARPRKALDSAPHIL